MSLEARCREAAKRLEDTDFLRVVSDDDADGIAAAGILTRALDRAAIPFHLTLDRLQVDQYRDLQSHDAVLLLDQGAGELDELADHPGKVIVLDHHQIEGRAPHALHVNPHLEGIDGTHDACTAALAFLTALELSGENAELAPIAMAGIVGDRQHAPELGEVNAAIARRGVEAGSVSLVEGLSLPASKPLADALATSVDPYLPTVAGRASRAASFLEELGIPPRDRLRDLSERDQRRLTSAIVAHLVDHDVEPDAVEQVAGERYEGEVCGRRIHAGRLSALFNACEREDEPSLGVAIAHGDSQALRDAESHVERYQDSLLEGLVQLENDPPEPMDAIQVFDAVDPDLVGAHCGLGMTYLFAKDKPTIGLKSADGNLKVSARATPQLVDAGLDLAEALAEAADEHGGNGGGHPIAAGAMFPADERGGFLARLDELVGDQLHG
jgi:single-stranded DNA-specific DHH superfamily exonuclease